MLLITASALAVIILGFFAMLHFAGSSTSAPLTGARASVGEVPWSRGGCRQTPDEAAPRGGPKSVR
jgi:hypothetical protein